MVPAARHGRGPRGDLRARLTFVLRHRKNTGRILRAGEQAPRPSIGSRCPFRGVRSCVNAVMRISAAPSPVWGASRPLSFLHHHSHGGRGSPDGTRTSPRLRTWRPARPSLAPRTEPRPTAPSTSAITISVSSTGITAREVHGPPRWGLEPDGAVVALKESLR